MSTKITIAILVIIIAILGWSTYKSYKNSAPTNTNTGTMNETVPTNEGSSVVSVSFICPDKNHFIAEFPKDGEVNIIVLGDLARTVPKVAGVGQRYEDNAYVYVFAGEEVNVTTKSTKKTITCTQPVDPNNAPVNFGDMDEGGAGFGGSTQPDVSFVVSKSIVGQWKSNEDAKFTREFKSNGTISDSYEGKIVSTGKWQVFTSVKPLKVSFPIEANAVYVQMTASGSQAETLNFRVNKLTPETLELMYMDRGSVNTFTRIK